MLEDSEQFLSTSSLSFPPQLAVLPSLPAGQGVTLASGNEGPLHSQIQSHLGSHLCHCLSIALLAAETNMS